MDRKIPILQRIKKQCEFYEEGYGYKLTLSTCYWEDILKAFSHLIDKAKEEGFDKFEIRDTSQHTLEYRELTYDYIREILVSNLKNKLDLEIRQKQIQKGLVV